MTVFLEANAREIALDGVRLKGLEEFTGADMMVSRLTMPATTRVLIQRHVDAGALLIQCKFSEDLAASVGDRLNESLARMISVTRRTCQHVLLFIGTLGEDAEGFALINGRKTHMSMTFSQVNMAIFSWIARGGVFFSLSRVGELAEFVDDVDKKLVQFNAESYKFILSKPEFPDDPPNIHDDPLQMLVPVKDARRALIGFKGLGVETVNKVWTHCGDFKSAMMFLTDPESAGKIEGIGVKTIASIRKQCGLEDGDGSMMWETETPVGAKAKSEKLIDELWGKKK